MTSRPRFVLLITIMAVVSFGAPSAHGQFPIRQILREVQRLSEGSGDNTEQDDSQLISRTRRVPRKKSAAELRQLIDTAFEKPAVPLKPNLVIFPVVDGEGKVHPRCLGYGRTAALAACYGPARRIAASISLQTHLFRSLPENSTGTTFNAETIDLCTRAMDAEMYVVSSLVLKGAAYELTMKFHGAGNEFPDATESQDIGFHELNTIPGRIAQFVLNSVKIEVSANETKRLNRLALPNRGDELVLGQITHGDFIVSNTPLVVEGVVKRNPESLAAWDTFFRFTWDEEHAWNYLQKTQPPSGDFFTFRKAVLQFDRGHAEEAIVSLLPLAATHRDDSFFFYFLTRSAMLLEEEKLVKHLLSLWSSGDLGYAGCLWRGRTIREWAWDARGTGWAFTVTADGWKNFTSRLQQADQELQQAVKLNDSGAQAWKELIIIDNGLGRPRNVMESHFEKAIRFNPRWIAPYQEKLTYLQPRWHGKPADLLTFGRECVATRYWHEGIPQLFTRVVSDFGTNADGEGSDYSAFQSPTLWKAIQEYHQQAWQYGRRRDRHTALYNFAKWGAMGGHYKEVTVPFQRITLSKELDGMQWKERSNFQFLANLVDAKTGALSGRYGFGYGAVSQPLSKATVALASGDLEATERYLDEVNFKDKDLRRPNVTAMREAIQLGQRIKQDRAIDFSPEELRKVGLLDAAHFWKAENDALVCTLPGGVPNRLVFPIGIQHGTITATIEITGPDTWVEFRSHVNSLRDEVAIQYIPEEEEIRLIRGRFLLKKSKLQDRLCKFRATWGPAQDELKPADGVTWTTPVLNDEPGCFSILCGSGQHPGSIRIRELKIALSD